MPTNDNEVAVSSGAFPMPDSHGHAALLLVESLIHGLLERSIISVADAVELIETAVSVQTDFAEAADGHRAPMRRSRTLLAAIAESLRHYDGPSPSPLRFTSATYFPAVIDLSGGNFRATFPDFPDCVANAGTISDVCIEAEKALALHIARMVEHGIPPPTRFADMEPKWGTNDVARVMVRVDNDLLEEIDAVASDASASMADAGRAKLLRGEQPPPGGPG
jgi:predicted RNase H-like HicB family nuclease